jgi:hypothetical protein
MNFKRLLICFVSLAAMSAVACVLACVWSVDPDMGYTSYFRRDIPEKNNYYYSYLNYYDDGANKTTDREENIREWKKHLGGPITDEDVEKLIYTIPLAKLQEIYRKAGSRRWDKITGEWAANGAMRRIIRSRDMNTLNYLLYAKACEQQAGKRTESWDAPPVDPGKQDSLLQRGLELYRGSKPEFTRLRYAFQVIRLAYYCNRNEDCVQYYHEMIEPAKKSKALAKWWALAFYAGAQESPVDAAYQYARVFVHCPRYSSQAMTSYRWLVNEVDTADVLLLCRDNLEKAVVHAMTGFTCSYPTLEPLKQVHTLCPACPYIETLLIREINKIEDGLNSARFFINDSLNRDGSLLYARELKDMAVRYAGLHEVQQPALWYTAAAYLAYLLDEYDQAALLTDIAEKERPAGKVKEQLMAIRLLVDTESGQVDRDTEARILPSLQWLMEKREKTGRTDQSFAFFDRTLGHYFAETLPDLYFAAGQPVKAALCMGIADRYSAFARENINNPTAFVLLDRYTSVVQLQEMLHQLTDIGTLSPFESFLYRYNSFDGNTIFELIGTKHLRALRFEEAAVCFKQLSGASDFFHLPCNPFADPPVTGWKNCQLPEDVFASSKLSFALEMAELQNRIKTASKPDAEDLYRFASGLYQMSWYGNSWQLLSYEWRTYSDVGKKALPGEEFYHFYRVDPAKEYYMQAFERTRDKDLKARCLFMASHCHQTTAPDIYAFKNGKYTCGSYFHNNPYFDRLYKKYRRTAYYRNMVTRCSYLADFEKMKR